ncbi:MAG: hypothetical protein KF729_04345 [Sandaracinaceae bacterium]|nr:hypothetical protein [Sandaracinaceae bacterium]
MRMAHPVAGRAVLYAALFLGLAGPARAQEVDAETTAAARAVFDQGMAAVDAGEHARAADLFARSIALRDSPVTRTNLALALIEIGQLVSASEHLRVAIRNSRPDSRVRILAQRFFDELRPRLGGLRVAVTGETEATVVHLDGAPMAEALIGVEQPVDPGTHTVTLLRHGQVLTEQRVEVGAGRTVGVTLVARAMTAAERAALVSEADAEDRREGGGGVEGEAWFWVLVAALAAGAAAGIVAAVLLSDPPPPQYTLGDSGTAHATLRDAAPPHAPLFEVRF